MVCVHILLFQNLQCDDVYEQGVCDDACRTDECLYDGDDCSLGCVDDTCKQIYQFWLYLSYLAGIGSEHKLDHDTACIKAWPLAVDQLEIEEAPGNCHEILAQVDYNNDTYINFREFVVIVAADLSGGHASKAMQINCSQCIGVEYYNI